MTDEEKQILILIADLYARIPYGVKVAVYGSGKLLLKNLINSSIGWYVELEGAPTDFSIDEIKPYLRPLSSMTEEEKKELLEIVDKETQIIIEQLKTSNCGIKEGKYHFNSLLEFDWLNKKHFDYRTIKDEDGTEKTMIELGLALEAPKDMYNIK